MPVCLVLLQGSPKESQPRTLKHSCPQPPCAELQEGGRLRSCFRESAAPVSSIVGKRDGGSPVVPPRSKARARDTRHKRPPLAPNTEASKQPGKGGEGNRTPWECPCRPLAEGHRGCFCPAPENVSLLPCVHCSQLTTSLPTVVPMQGRATLKTNNALLLELPHPPKSSPQA